MITTVSLNSSFDKTAVVSRLLPGQVNRLESIRYDAGGKGLNVAIVLRRLGINASCVGFLGKDDEAAFLSMLVKEDLPFHHLSVPGKIRTNLKVLDQDSGLVTEFNEPGASITEEMREQFIAFLRERASGSRFVVFGGRLPPGFPDTAYQAYIQALPDQECVLDAAGEALLQGIKAKPFLVKPNLPELEAVFGKELHTLQEIRDAACLLVHSGARNVIVSMGKHGALLTDGEKSFFSPSLNVRAKSTVGAGDAMLGGVLAGLDQGEALPEALRYGIAAGAASVMTEGTGLVYKPDFDGLLPRVTLQEV